MQGLLIALMTWISSVSGLALPAEVPDVLFRTPLQITCIAMGIDPCTEEEASKVEGVVLGAYLDMLHVILLWNTWDMSNVGDQTILVHELTHSMQNREDYQCPGDREKEAWSTAAKYMELYGLDMYEEMGTSKGTIVMMYSCSDGILY